MGIMLRPGFEQLHLAKSATSACERVLRLRAPPPAAAANKTALRSTHDTTRHRRAPAYPSTYGGLQLLLANRT